MSRLHFSSSLDTLSPQHTAVRFLRVMLTVKLVSVIGSIALLSARVGLNLATVNLLVSWPIVPVWLLALLPVSERRLGRFFLPTVLTLTIMAQSLESGLLAFLTPPEGRLRVPFGSALFLPLEVRFFEPLFLLLVAVVLGAWVYGRRGAWLTAGLSGALMIINSIAEDVLTESARVVDFGPFRSTPLSILSVVILRVSLLIVVGYIVGTLAEQERQQTRALSAANAQLRAQAMVTEQLAVARERNRLARDLHDTLAHSLAGLVVQLQAIDTLVKDEPEAAHTELIKARQLAQKGLQGARQAIQDLRVNPIEDLGLARALEREAIDFGDRAGVQVNVRVSDPPVALPGEVAAQVWHIAQEALHNVEHHADAKCVTVSLAQTDGQLELVVADDGRGFAADEVRGDRFGLRGMRERAEMIGGALTVSSTAGQGTRVELTLNTVALGSG